MRLLRNLPLTRKSRDARRTATTIEILHKSLLLDPVWYRQNSSDLRDTPVDVARHYLEHGAREGRNPHPLFDTNFYLEQNPDVAASDVNPLVHYILHGAKEGRDPHPLFDADWYQEQLSPQRLENTNSLSHYLTEGWRRGLSPHWLFDPRHYVELCPGAMGVNPLLHYISSCERHSTHLLFDPTWYLQQNMDAAAAEGSPLLHYLRSGWREKRSPHPLFDPTWYLNRYPDVAEAGTNPFRHYMCSGWTERRSPHRLFDGKWYVGRYADVAAAHLNPLLHYCSVGWRERRDPHPLFDVRWHLDQYPEIEQAAINPLLHYVQSGWRDRCNTHPLFDSNWYLQHYPDVASADLDPLQHYLSSGWTEDRNPGPFFNTAWYRSQYDNDGPEDECPLCRYLARPERNLQQPHPLFDAVWYTASCATNSANHINPFVDYVTRGVETGRTPNPDFSRLVDLLRVEAGTPRDVARGVFEKALTEEIAQKFLKTGAAGRRGVLDVHYEVWRAPKSLEGKKVCLFVAYAPDGYVPKSTLRLLRALRREGLVVICIAASGNSGQPYADEEIECDGLISRDNFGYDFASWALGLQIMPSIWKAKTIIFANDSIFGPVSKGALEKVLKKIETSDSDYLGLTQSWQVKHHYQSYFFALKSRAIRHPGVRHIWTTLQCVEDRDEAIMRYEVPMLDAMANLGLKTEAVFPLGDCDFEKDVNPTLDHWRELIAEGFPFIKVQTLRDDINGVDKRDWQSSVAMDPDLLAVITERLGGRAEQNRKATIVRPGQ